MKTLRRHGPVHRYRFNDDKSAVVLAFSYINNAGLVWRQDGDNQGLLRIHNDYDEAKQDFQDRVSFIKEMEVVS